MNEKVIWINEKVICNGWDGCGNAENCGHSIPHDCCANVHRDEECWDHSPWSGKRIVKCIPSKEIYKEEITSTLLTAEPRELTLEEIAVAAMSAVLRDDADRNYKLLAKKCYDIAEAMKAEKERRER